LFTFVIQEKQDVAEQDKLAMLPVVFGPYENQAEAVGMAIDFIRSSYGQEPKFEFKGFGDHMENLVITCTPSVGDPYIAATINKCE
jgi:hypothetical protein